jgi:diadenosine tetraphosphate (Ap4A) HIT family hydrolase
MPHDLLNCVFCRELAGSRLTNFGSQYPELESRVICSTSSLVAFPCIGQLAPGHFLIIPRPHFCTFKDVQTSNSDVADEVTWLLEKVHARLGLNWQKSLIFEHGASQMAEGGCGIYHAHLHVLPQAEQVSHVEVYPFQLGGWSRTLKDVWAGTLTVPYVLAGTGESGFRSESLGRPLESQTLRKNVAKALRRDEWDWRKAHREDAMFVSINSMRTISVDA